MSRDALRLVLKEHRFESLVVVLSSLALALVAGVVGIRLVLADVSSECVGLWDLDPEGARICNPAIADYMGILGSEVPLLLVAMTILPFVVGLIGGTPVVGKELELSTAQTAWWIAPSRRQWLVRQALPIAVLLLLVVGLAAALAEWLEALRVSAFAGRSFSSMGGHGVLLLARGVAAFAIGVLLGSITGRVVPSLVAGAMLALLLVFGMGLLRDNWAANQALVPVADAQSSTFEGIPIEQGWTDSSGTVLRAEEALTIASRFNPQDPEIWLLETGYRPIVLAIPWVTASQWELIESAAWIALGLACFVGTAVVVERRRPI